MIAQFSEGKGEGETLRKEGRENGRRW